MKLKFLGIFILITFIFAGIDFNAKAQRPIRPGPTNSLASFMQNPGITNLPGAIITISNVLAVPVSWQGIPEISTTNAGHGTAYYSLQRPSQPPLPGDVFPSLPLYELDEPSQVFLIDDRSVDYKALDEQQAVLAMSRQSSSDMPATPFIPDTNSLWLEVPTNALPDSVVFNVVLHNTTNGGLYEILTKTDFLAGAWTIEKNITGGSGKLTPVSIARNGRPNLFVRACTGSLTNLVILSQPLDQTVLAYDMVSFGVVAGGSRHLTYQWTHAGTNLPGATASSYTI